MSDEFRWIVLGTGRIAGKFAGQLVEHSAGRVAAVGSRSLQSARRFAARFGGQPYGDYQAAVAHQPADAVYVALPNSLHHPWTLAALAAGKHVLCEKPLAADAAEAAQMFDAARRAGRVLIEAFMYRCHPAVERLIREVRQGLLGRLQLIRTHFTFRRPADPTDVRYQPELAGGALMDVGSYCVNLARALTGQPPDAVRVLRHEHETGVEDYAAGLLAYPDGALCALTCGMTVQCDRTTFLAGEAGWVAIDTPWFCNGRWTLVQDGRRREVETAEPRGLYALEALALARAARGEAAPFVTEQETLDNMRTLDELRRA